MKQLKFTKQTSVASLVFFILYAIYGIFRIPYVQYILCLFAGAIAYGMSGGSYEIAVIALLFLNFLFTLLTSRVSAFMNMDGARKVSERVRGFKSEGFEDGGADEGADAGVDNVPPMTSEEEDEAVTPTPESNDTEPEAADSFKDISGNALKAGFQSGDGLFKLGKLPSDKDGGLHIDSGSTVINALKALKPEQIAAMTQDTKQLIETQKSLMSMLQTFSPMVTEGKELMNTFNNMFGSSSGAKIA
jgi:hypothetical protein